MCASFTECFALIQIAVTLTVRRMPVVAGVNRLQVLVQYHKAVSSLSSLPTNWTQAEESVNVYTVYYCIQCILYKCIYVLVHILDIVKNILAGFIDKNL